VTEVLRPVRNAIRVPARNPYEEAIAGIWREVLHRSDVGVFDDFFDLDGHSLLAIKVVTRIRKALGVDIPVTEMFEAPTVAALAAAVAAAQGSSLRRPVLATRPAHSPPMLSYDQQRLWLEDQLRPGAAYNVHGRRRLLGELNVSALERSISAILHRHEALRTRFPVIEGRPAQLVDEPDERWRIAFTDVSGSPDASRAAARQLADRQAAEPFDLADGPLFRCLLVRLGDREHLLSVTMHHIVSDAWSIGVFLQELSALYQVGGDPDQAQLPELPVQYRDYAVWQRGWLTDTTIAPELAYWRRHLAGAPPALALPVAGRRTPAQGFIGGEVRSQLSGAQTAALHEMCRRHGATPFMALLACLAALLHRWCGQSDLVIGVPVTTRTDAGLDQLIGFFVNTLPLRIDVSDDPSFADLLRRVRQVAVDGYAHGDAPFDRLMNDLQPPRDPTRTPLFQVIMNMMDVADEHGQLDRVDMRHVQAPVLPSKFDLMLNARDTADAVDLQLQFHRDRYDPALMRILLDQFGALLNAVSKDPDQRLSAHPLPGPALPAASDACRADGSAPRLALRAYAEQAPDQVAVVDGADQWSYRQLNDAAERVARILAESERRTGIRVVRRRLSAGFLVAVLGCLEAAVPFEVTDSLPGAEPDDATVIDADGGSAPGAVDPGAILREQATARFTPQGRAAGGGLPDWATERLSVGPEDRLAVLSATPEHLMSALGTTLAAGATLCIPDPAATTDIAGLVEWLRTTAISVVYLNPPVLRAMAGFGPLPDLRYALLGNAGDLLSHDVDVVRTLGPDCRCVSLYRVTSTGLPLAVFEVPDGWHARRAPLRVPMGDPLDGEPVELLDPTGQIAAIGELRPIRFGGRPTGDFGRRRPDGSVELIPAGVAHRAHLDPAETVAALRDLPAVADAIVLDAGLLGAADGMEKTEPAGLIGYVVAPDGGLTVGELRQHLAGQVPEYLVPDRLILLDHIPLTRDGDYDLAALPDPDYGEPAADSYVAPRTALERQLAEIFQEILEVERVGITDTFFELNGFSLLATQLAARIRATFEVELSLRDVFESPTVEGLAQQLTRAREAA
jgi:non-ribosomal peptide synthetase component F/acyl carrier protein